MREKDLDKFSVMAVDIGTQGIEFKVRHLGTRITHSADVPFNANRWGLDDRFMLPERYEGHAEQPVAMHVEAISAGINELIKYQPGDIMKRVIRITATGQQHGAFLTNDSNSIVEGMYKKRDHKRMKEKNETLLNLLMPRLADHNARTWRTSSSSKMRELLTKYQSNPAEYIEKAGSLPFERFTATAFGDFALRSPMTIARAERLFLIEQLFGIIATGSYNYPMGWGGACGTAIFDWKEMNWHPELFENLRNATNDQITSNMLPEIVKPGTSLPVSAFFKAFSGVHANARIYEAAGDNPAARNAVPIIDGKQTNLYSFGSSGTANFGIPQARVDQTGNQALMFDYLGQPFLLGCMTNVTTSWDYVRSKHDDMTYGQRDDHMRKFISEVRSKDGKSKKHQFYICFLNGETMPEMGKTQTRNFRSNPANDITAVINTTLANMVVHTEENLPNDNSPVYVTGGGSKSNPVMQVFASMLGREVRRISSGGPVDGCLNAAEFFVRNEARQDISMASIMGDTSFREIFRPEPKLERYFRQEGGFLQNYKRFLAETKKQ